MFCKANILVSTISSCCQYSRNRLMSTVFALSSGHGKCGVAVIRVTGKSASEAITSMTKEETLPSPRKAVLRTIVQPATSEPLDKGLVLWFPSPHSFTGEDCVEFQVHGGYAVTNSIMKGLASLPNFSFAKPGEFTRRAFARGKMELTAVEGLADLIDAQTEEQRKIALRQTSGELGKTYSKWRQEILSARALIETYLDFSEEGHEQITDVAAKLRPMLDSVRNSIETHLSDGRRGELLRNGLKLAIIGCPNVGKSSCLNMLLQRPAAIVSHIPGTTRDTVEGFLDISGYPVNILDTAGIRKTEDIIEKEGVKRSLIAARNADAAIIVLNAKDIINCIGDELNIERILSFIVDTELSTKDLHWLKEDRYVILLNKIDLLDEGEKELLLNLTHSPYWATRKVTLISLLEGEGVQNCLGRIKDLCDEMCADDSLDSSPPLTSERHRLHLMATFNALLHIDKESLLEHENTVEVAAHYLNICSRELGNITGQVTTEQVLDEIFKTFCIGK